MSVTMFWPARNGTYISGKRKQKELTRRQYLKQVKTMRRAQKIVQTNADELLRKMAKAGKHWGSLNDAAA